MHVQNKNFQKSIHDKDLQKLQRGAQDIIRTRYEIEIITDFPYYGEL
jgi:hypothetical protein